MTDQPTGQQQYSTQVVGAAIFDSLTDPQVLLVAQRSAPEWAAGLWEFPGGKVEYGETEQQALVREIHEELGVMVRTGTEIVGPHEQGWELNEDAAMRVFCAQIIDGHTPEALQDHSELRWVDLDRSLLELDWIPADLKIVEALLEKLGR